MKQFQIKEEKRPKLPVRFSQEIANEIEWINFRNFGNDEALSQWNDYIEGIILHISDPVIAWDNMNRYRHTSNEETFINENGMDVGFLIEIDNHTNQSFVYVFYLDLNIDEFGLVESKQRGKKLIITEQQYNELMQKPLGINVKDMRTNESKERKNVIRLTESMLKSMIAESLREALNEIFEPVGKIDEFEIINGSWGTKRCDSLKKFGYYNDVRMYYSNEHTYCLMRREDNGTFFFAEIVPAPELGKNETKYEPKRPSDIPNNILRDAKKFLHNKLILEK